MRFVSIEISNFRQYEDLKLDFPRNGKYDLHIINAENGVGKTNILNAITWCLYGIEPHLGNESKSLPRVNLSSKNRARADGQDRVCTTVTIHAEDDRTSLVFSRSEEVNVKTDFPYKDRFSVLVNEGGGDEIKEGDEAKAYVDKYMPVRIREYFYFDGEQLDSYFIQDDSERIKNTIHSISQVDVVTRVKDRLGEVMTDLKREAGKKEPDIKKINKETEEIKERISGLEESMRTIRQQIQHSNTVVAQNSEQLKGQENVPELEERYEKLKIKREELQKKWDDKKQKLYQFVRQSKIALSLYPSASATLCIIEKKEQENVLPPNIDKKLLISLLHSESGKCVICGHTLGEDAKAHIEHLISKISVSSETSNLLMRIKSELERIVEAVKSYPKMKESVVDELRYAEDQYNSCVEELQQVDDELRRFGDKERIRVLHEERKKHEDLLRTNREKYAITNHQLEDEKETLKANEEKLQRALKQKKACKEIMDRLQFADSARSIVSNIEQEMMQEVRQKMEKRTMDYFGSLIWKKGVYDHIILDENYQLDLIHRDGYPCVGSCSAAERSLLALAFTLALHEVSGFNSLLFIDTPVSRVSGDNRANFAKVLKTVSEKKQLILAFTPDEYSESIRNVFEPIVPHPIHLTMNESNDITSVR